MNTISQIRHPLAPLLLLLGLVTTVPPANAEPFVRMKTVAGDFFIDLTPGAAPGTVENFLDYVNSGAYNDSFVHRSVPGFVIQGGGFFWPLGGNLETISKNPAILNEFNVSNLRGTVAMARTSVRDSATSEWFVNLSDDNAFLDNDNGGFTVFGTVDDRGMTVVDAIAALPTVNAGSPFNTLPVREVTAATTRNEVVLITSATEFSVISAPAAAILPASRSVGVGVSATGFATIVNSANNAAASCSISPATSLPADFIYRQTNPSTNDAFGPNNPQLDIPPLGAVSMVFSLTPSAPIATTAVAFNFTCGNAIDGASLTPGVNTFELSASTNPGADVVALAATVGGAGINDISNSTGSGAFAVATVNVGAQETITVTADTGSASLPLGLFVCPTDPVSGLCASDPAESSSVAMSANGTATFSVFAQLINASDSILFDPAGKRAFVRFRNAAGELRGSTSVALRTVP